MYWLQRRPDEGGRTVLVWCARGAGPRRPGGLQRPDPGARVRGGEYWRDGEASSSRTSPTDGSTGRTAGRGADAGHTGARLAELAPLRRRADPPRRLGRLRSRVARGAGGPERPRGLPCRRLAAAAPDPRGAGLLRLAAAEPRRQAAVLADLEPPAAPLHGHRALGRRPRRRRAREPGARRRRAGRGDRPAGVGRGRAPALGLGPHGLVEPVPRGREPDADRSRARLAGLGVRDVALRLPRRRPDRVPRHA